MTNTTNATNATNATSTTDMKLTRRTLLKATGAAGAFGVASMAAAGSALLGGNAEAHAQSQAQLPAQVQAPMPQPGDTIAYSQCNVNCGGACIFKWHVRDGKVLYMETDDTGDADHQSRACLRGRSMRRWLNHPDRLLYPMKRVGKRGEGAFERISWDEAIQIIHDNLERIYREHGPESVYMPYGSGMYSTTGRHVNHRLLGLLGGFLNQGLDYSTHMMGAVMPYMFGSDPDRGSVYSPYDDINASSFSEAERNSDLVVMFGNNPAETRMGGANIVWDFARTREAVKERGGKIVQIDFRLNESMSGHSDEWIPIRTGTDAALCSALIHEFIIDGATDEDFLARYCVGWDESTMPESARGKNLSYKDYIMGTGYDGVAKTPEWAAEITQIPAARIRELAVDLETAKAPFIVQGWGSQRHTNGEETTRAISMVAIALGQIGLPGTNTGQREAEPSKYLVANIPFENPVTAAIPVYQFLNAIDHGREMTATNSGLTGTDELGTDIKCLWSYAGNCLTNQHGDINYAHDLLVDESKVEFILVWDTVMTDSARYADILLPDAMRSEQLNMRAQGYSEWYTGVVVGGPAQEPPGECRSSYDVCADLAESFGLRDEFTEGRTQEEWIRYLYEQGREENPEMPTWNEMLERGVYKVKLDPVVGLADFRRDPDAHPLGTPSGKIEIYSETLAQLNDTWELAADEKIYAIPEFHGGFQGYGETTDEFPLYCSGWHGKARTHSSYGFIEELEQASRQQLWINPIDAEPRGVADGDMVSVTSPAGEVRIEARVTNRIIPGTIGMPQGAWHDADMSGDRIDRGGCINTLTTYRPTPLAKGNGNAHSIIAQVQKA